MYPRGHEPLDEHLAAGKIHGVAADRLEAALDYPAGRVVPVEAVESPQIIFVRPVQKAVGEGLGVLEIKAKDIEDERAAVREHRSKESERPGAQTLGDLIKAQIRVAAGEELPFRQEEIRQQGVAIEARINAEDTEKSGRLLPLDADLQLSDDIAAKAHDAFIDRQVGRRALVGSTDVRAPVRRCQRRRSGRSMRRIS